MAKYLNEIDVEHAKNDIDRKGKEKDTGKKILEMWREI